MDEQHHLMLINPTPREGVMYFLAVDGTKPKWTKELKNTIHTNLVAVATLMNMIPDPANTKVIIVNRSKSRFSFVGCQGRPDVHAICTAMLEAPGNRETPVFYADQAGMITSDSTVTLDPAWLKWIAGQLADGEVVPPNQFIPCRYI